MGSFRPKGEVARCAAPPDAELRFPKIGISRFRISGLRSPGTRILACGLLLALSAPAGAGPAEDHAVAVQRYRAGDLIGAMPILRKAADQGHAPSQALLGDILDKAEENAEAVAYFRKAAEQGNADGEFGLGTMYASGEGVAKNPAEALRWITLAADRGHAQAVSVLAQAYLRNQLGITPETRDNARAMARIRTAAERGDSIAVEGLVRIYRTGDFGVAPDAQQAKLWEAKLRELRPRAAAAKK